MGDLETVKLFLMAHTGLARDALHIYVAMIVFLGSCLIFGWKTRQWKPLLLVLLAAILGEVWDVIDTIRANDPVRLGENWQDIWNTTLVPAMLFLLSRYSTIFVAPKAGKPDEVSGNQP